MASKRQYSERDKAVALATYESCGNVSRTAKLCRVPRTTLIHWIAGEGTNEDVTKIGQIKKGELAERLEELAHLLIDAIPGKVDEANMQSMATSLGIAIDKMQLLRGKATAITDDASLTDAERANRVIALFDAARARRDGQSALAEDNNEVLS